MGRGKGEEDEEKRGRGKGEGEGDNVKGEEGEGGRGGRLRGKRRGKGKGEGGGRRGVMKYDWLSDLSEFEIANAVPRCLRSPFTTGKDLKLRTPTSTASSRWGFLQNMNTYISHDGGKQSRGGWVGVLPQSRFSIEKY
jgi:hypothetical protein